MIKAEKECGQDLGLVGEITHVDVTLIHNCIDSGTIPVVATIVLRDNRTVRCIISMRILRLHYTCAALNAEKFVLMTDVRGLLRDKDNEDSLISVVHVSDVPGLKRRGIIKGGMIPKVDCCVEAVRRGVSRTHIIDGRIAHSIPYRGC